MEARLRQALQRAEEVGQALADPASRQRSCQAPVARPRAHPARARRPTRRPARPPAEDLEQARELAPTSPIPSWPRWREADLARLPAEIAALTAELHELLLPRDPHDDRDAIMEIRAGTGGDEAALVRRRPRIACTSASASATA